MQQETSAAKDLWAQQAVKALKDREVTLGLKDLVEKQAHREQRVQLVLLATMETLATLVRQAKQALWVIKE